MMEHSGLFTFYLLLALVYNTAWAQGLRMLEMKVPPLADPRDELTLGCEFDMGNEELYSVKWYKDDQEFFRYTPRQRPRVLSFPVAGVHLVGDGGACNTDRCTVRLTGLTTAHSSGSYRCEVSTEAPTFRLVFDTANVTVAALGREDPRIDGVASTYAPGDLVSANCSSAPADPAPTITWWLNGKQAPSAAVGQPRTSRPDAQGLVTRSVALRFQAENHHFAGTTGSGTLELRCVVSTPAIPAPPRDTTATAALRHNHLSNQKLEWPNSHGTVSSSWKLWICVLAAVAAKWTI